MPSCDVKIETKNGKKAIEINNLESHESVALIDKINRKIFFSTLLYCRGLSVLETPEKKDNETEIQSSDTDDGDGESVLMKLGKDLSKFFAKIVVIYPSIKLIFTQWYPKIIVIWTILIGDD